jgi:hypothetical protein
MKFDLIKPAALALLASFALSGCHTNPTLYQWGGYQPQVYQHFKGESPNQQIEILEKDLQTISAKGQTPPPGFHAHLGMLYAMVGRQDQVEVEFENEKKLFPESTVYMDFLLKKAHKDEK